MRCLDYSKGFSTPKETFVGTYVDLSAAMVVAGAEADTYIVANPTFTKQVNATNVGTIKSISYSDTKNGVTLDYTKEQLMCVWEVLDLT